MPGRIFPKGGSSVTNIVLRYWLVSVYWLICLSHNLGIFGISVQHNTSLFAVKYPFIVV